KDELSSIRRQIRRTQRPLATRAKSNEYLYEHSARHFCGAFSPCAPVRYVTDRPSQSKVSARAFDRIGKRKYVFTQAFPPAALHVCAQPQQSLQASSIGASTSNAQTLQGSSADNRGGAHCLRPIAAQLRSQRGPDRPACEIPSAGQ